MKKILYILILLAIGNTAFAASTFKVTTPQNNNTFRITRTGNTAVQETIDWRVVSLSAIEGIHYSGIQGGQAGVYSGTVTFAANETYKEITINELTPSDAYMYQNGGTRKYRFEVLDKDGSILASKDRTMSTGTSVPSSGLFNVKTGTIESSEFWIDDSGYKQTNSPHTINRSSFYTDAEKNYIVTLGVPLHMTLELQAKEEDDAYEYLQVLIDNTTGCDSENDADKGNPGTPSLSRYMAGFEMAPSDTYTTYKTYTFPVANVADGTKATDPWGYGTDFPLSMQKFKNGCRSTDYKIIVPNSFNTITVRFDASGSKGSDKWWIRNLKAKLTAINNVAPVVINNYKVSGGRHQKGNTIYVSVPFKEIVTVTGTPTLSSNWGTLSYIAGSGSNVLTFKGTIDPSDNNAFSVSGYSLNGGTIKDLAGNSFSGSISHNFGTTLDSEYAWSTSDFNSLNDGSYEIYTTQDLRHLALMVNSGNNNCSGLTFRQAHDITYTHTTEWDDATSQEDNYTAIGTNTNKFQGTFDGQNHTICGIRIYRGEVNLADINQGLFGGISGGTVRAVNLADVRITGHSFVAGIAGQIVNATVEDCTVAADVCIHAVHNSSNCHGGIVGYSQGTMQRCLSRARLTVANSTTDHTKYGAIVGYNNTAHAVKDCIVIGATVPDVTYRGAIIGQANEITKVQRNYYRACTVAGVENATGVGVGYDENTTTPHDVTTNQGARALYSLTLPEHASVVRTASATLPGTGNATYTTGADIDGAPYAFYGAQLSLSYDAAAIPDGYDVLLSVTKTVSGDAVTFTDHGNHTYTISSMPAADITVSVTQIPVISYIDADGNLQSHGCTPIVSDIHTYQTLGRTEGWYVVNNDVTDDYGWSSKFLDQAVHIILCDGKTFSRTASANGHDAIEVKNGSLSIYGQSLGTGRLIATSQSTVISVKSDINFNGGIVSSTTTNYNSVYTQNGDITIRRGNITAQAAYYGIKSNSGTIILGCSSAADHITAKSYGAEKGVKVADGQTLTDGISSHTFTGTLSSDQLTALAGKTLMKSLGNVAYLDGNGQAQTCSDYTILWDSTIPVDGSDEGSIGTADQDSWYVASTNYTFGKKLNALGHVHLILLDGTTFTVNGTETGLNSKDLSIYGQSLGTGTLTASATDKAMFVDGNLVINGGTTNATGGNYGIYVDGGYLAINGGTVNATGTTNGIYVGGNITLGWSRTSDRITASSYYCGGIFSVKNGQFHTDGSNNYSGTLSADQIASLAGKTLQPLIPDPASLTQGTKDGVSAWWGTYYNGTTNQTLVGATAYTLGTDHKLYRLGDDGRTIPKNTAVVIIALSADASLVPAGTGDLSITDHATGGNQLHGSDSAVTVSGLSGTPHVLSLSAGAIGFRQFTGDSIPAGKAYYIQ